ncbi:shikimate dehydrogenase [Aquamicrobium sp. LC103]|uniref:shikimate dehydrogenase family protein n=1 Tax=Aquamicrobium sp. LC103 TaxID=1120658 RepID=UPI00063EC10A|nr:shikimate dehydrogenase [Aquamicrobium sp. LC103]TKT74751.1 shikimate dehydrogenase [Aquamicrobium sp. LC103]
MRIRLGLIGDNIKRSKSPLLHRLAGQLCGIEVSYEPLIPADMGLDFDAVFERCRAGGFRGINITYPYKEQVVSRLRVDDPRVRSIGACNTVLFEEGRQTGFNTDYSGFAAAFRANFPDRSPAKVAMAGAGGVGKAIGFALAELGATELRLFDPDAARAEALARSIARAESGLRVTLAGTIDEAAADCDGLVNCTPLGMVGYPGTAVPKRLMRSGSWAFDAVYTPVETQFLDEARAAGLEVMSGYELFFHQGVDAFRIFTGYEVDAKVLRAALLAPDADIRGTA